MRAAVFCGALRDQLRQRPCDPALAALLPHDEFAALAGVPNRPDYLMRRMGQDLGRCVREGRIEACLAANLDATLSAMTAAAASCERIKTTPIPFSYSVLLHRTAYLYCFLLPFGLDALGDELEEPFGMEPNDLPLDAICRAIEIDLRAALGDGDLPPALEAVDYCLL